MFRDSGQQQTTAHTALRLIGRAVGHLRQLMCGLSGHDALLHFGDGRLSLQCATCGYETPGWDLKPEPDRTDTAPAAPHSVGAPLFGERRAA